MKEQRQAAILELIAAEEIDTQDTLTARLIALGFAVTQATVSRDIKDLRLVKTLNHQGKGRYVSPAAGRDDAGARQLRIFVESVLSMDNAGNLLVLRTLPGAAQGAAGTMDDMKLPDVLGCIAGDDTILVILKTPEAALGMMERLSGLLR